MHFLCLQKTARGSINFRRYAKQRRESDQFYRQLTHSRKHGVVGEIDVSAETPVSEFDKDQRSRECIKNAISKNEFLGGLEETRINALVKAMYSQEFPANTRIIEQGDSGSHLYVSEEGTFDIYVGTTFFGSFGPGVAFGELALLYDTKRLCSIDAQTRAKVWVLDRKAFHAVMLRSIEENTRHNLKLLRQISILSPLPEEVLLKMSDLIVVEFFTANTYIVREGDSGTKFYIINGGKVRITKRNRNGVEEEQIVLEKGNYFGEKALYDDSDSRRRANAIALPPGTECYTIERQAFLDYLGGLESIRNKDWKQYSERRSVETDNWESQFQNLNLSDIIVEGTIGAGAYGRVELITVTSIPNVSFARKKVKKSMISMQGRQKLLYNEKQNLQACNSPFICKLHRTFKDNRYLYFLMEVCLGGDLRTALHRNGRFSDTSTRFIIACVLEGLDYLHSIGIIYRDLKPENIVISNRGYAKLTDLGSSKRVGPHKTASFIGTCDYLAPEIVENKGYNRAADYWSLGIVIYELLVGTTPFHDSNVFEIYNKIIKGIDEASMPSFLRSSSKNLIRALLHLNPTKRIGYLRNGAADVRNHRWFSGFHWRSLQKLSMHSPIEPKLKSFLDMKNFDRYLPDREAAPLDFSDWDANF